jgi:thiol-disulfide isomerase/thioredoxin
VLYFGAITGAIDTTQKRDFLLLKKPQEYILKQVAQEYEGGVTVKKGFCAMVLSVGMAFLMMGTAIASQAPEMPDVFPKFSSRTLDGRAVTDAIFSDKKLTVVNIWTTWCPPCIKEMPDLGRLGRSMPAGSQLVGIVLDVDGTDDPATIAQAKDILRKSDADFLQILPAGAMASVLGEVLAIPTTIFVTSQGEIIADPLVGSRSEENYRSYIEQVLRSVK